MNRRTLLLAVLLAGMLAAIGCSDGGGNPVMPSDEPGHNRHRDRAGSTQTHLWGFYNVYIDIESRTVEAVPVRDAMFSANVTGFLNSRPTGLAFSINETPIGPDYIDVDIDVTITHPFPGMPQYNGYDVKGVFIGNGSATLDYGGERYAIHGTDQSMMNEDGYTRWFNPVEFNVTGLFGYVPGRLATPGYTGTATLNAYKYFANNLSATGSAWNFVTTTNNNGVFTSGATNTRNYYLRFPNAMGVRYNYAVVASWESEDPSDHPANSVEAPALNVTVTPGVYYVDDSNNGGDLILDVDAFGWTHQPSTILVESTVLSSVYEFTPDDMIPTGGTDNYSTYHCEIPADRVSGRENQEFWVILQYDEFDYKCRYTPPTPGAAPNAELASYFRYDLEVLEESPCPDPAVTSIDPDYVFSGVQVDDATILGDNLLDGAQLAVKLVMAGESDIIGTDVQHVSDMEITADFDLDGAAEGFWDVVVTNGCGKEATGSEILEIFSCGNISGFSQSYDVCITTGYPHSIYGGYCGMAGTQSASTPYVIGATRVYNELGAMKASSGLSGSSQFLSSTSGVSYINRDVVCDSQDNVWFTDATNYSRLRYFPFDSSTGFGNVVNFGNIDSGWSIYRITIDENDNPVALGQQGSSLRVFHWNSDTSDWDTTDVPSEVIQGNYTQIGDFDYNPMMEEYVFVRKQSGNKTNLYAIDKSGELVAELEDIFEGFFFTGLPGIYIDPIEPACRVVTWGSWASFGTQPTPFTRMTAAYTDPVRTIINVGNISGNLNICSPRGQVAKGSNRLILGAHYINVWAKVPVPSNW